MVASAMVASLAVVDVWWQNMLGLGIGLGGTVREGPGMAHYGIPTMASWMRRSRLLSWSGASWPILSWNGYHQQKWSSEPRVGGSNPSGRTYGVRTYDDSRTAPY